MIVVEDYIGKTVIHNGWVKIIDDVSVIVNCPGNEVWFRLNDGQFAPASECEWYDLQGQSSTDKNVGHGR